MSEPAAVARSAVVTREPIQIEAGWQVSGCRSSAALTIADWSPLAKISIRARSDGAMAETLGVRPGQARRQPERLTACAAPGQWLVLSRPGSAAAEITHIESGAAMSAPGELVTVTDLTHGRTLIRVTGNDTASLISMVCPVDLDDDFAPNGKAFRSAVANVATEVIRDDRDGLRSYLVHCERSSGQYLFECLLYLGRPLGIEVDGFITADFWC